MTAPTAMTAPFIVGDRVFNTDNRDRDIIGIVTRVIDTDWCDVLWSSSEPRAWTGTIRRDGLVPKIGSFPKQELARSIVRIKISVRIRQEV